MSRLFLLLITICLSAYSSDECSLELFDFSKVRAFTPERFAEYDKVRESFQLSYKESRAQEMIRELSHELDQQNVKYLLGTNKEYIVIFDKMIGRLGKSLSRLQRYKTRFIFDPLFSNNRGEVAAWEEKFNLIYLSLSDLKKGELTSDFLHEVIHLKHSLNIINNNLNVYNLVMNGEKKSIYSLDRKFIQDDNSLQKILENGLVYDQLLTVEEQKNYAKGIRQNLEVHNWRNTDINQVRHEFIYLKLTNAVIRNNLKLAKKKLSRIDQASKNFSMVKNSYLNHPSKVLKFKIADREIRFDFEVVLTEARYLEKDLTLEQKYRIINTLVNKNISLSSNVSLLINDIEKAINLLEVFRTKEAFDYLLKLSNSLISRV